MSDGEKPIGYIFQPDGAAPDKWSYSHGARPDIDQGAFWTVKAVYELPFRRESRERQIPITGDDALGLKDTVQTYCTTCGRLLEEQLR